MSTLANAALYLALMAGLAGLIWAAMAACDKGRLCGGCGGTGCTICAGKGRIK